MTGQPARAWVLGFAGIAGVLAGCGKSGVQECLDLNDAQRYEEAARRCEEVYAAQGQAEAGVAAARAHYFLGHPDEVLGWRDRLAKAGKARPGIEALAAAVHQQRGEIGDPKPEWAWQLEYQQGLLAEARGDLPAAEAAYRRSIAIVEEMRRSAVFDELKAWLLDERRQPFEALFRLQARAGRVREALATAEHAQARTFLDAFLHASSATAAPKPDSSLQRIEGLESLLPAMSESPVAALQPGDRVLASFARLRLRPGYGHGCRAHRRSRSRAGPAGRGPLMSASSAVGYAWPWQTP